MSFVDKVTSFVIVSLDKAKKKAVSSFEKSFKRSVKKSFVKLFISLLSIFIAALITSKSQGEAKSSGQNVACLIVFFTYVGVLGWTLFDFAILLKKIGYLVFAIIKERSVTCGIKEYLNQKYKIPFPVFIGYDSFKFIGGLFSKKFDEVPYSDDAIKDFYTYVIKNTILYISIFAFFILVVNFGIKPILLQKAVGLSTWKVYFYPLFLFGQK